jgi:polar amino acid transport system substrate-binding protein
MRTIRFYTFSFTLILLAFCFFGCSKRSRSNEYKVAVDPSWFPLDLIGREKQVLGFSRDLLQEIAAIKKLRIATVRENWDNLISNLQEEKYNAIFSSMQPYIFYKNIYDFSDLYLNTGPVLILPFTSKIASLDMLSGKEIAVQRGSPAEAILAKYPGIIMRIYDSIPEALNDILIGIVDGAIADVLAAQAYCQDLYQGQLKIATGPLDDEGLRLVALHQKSSDLIIAFNEGLKELKQKGTYAELARKWGLSEQ